MTAQMLLASRGIGRSRDISDFRRYKLVLLLLRSVERRIDNAFTKHWVFGLGIEGSGGAILGEEEGEEGGGARGEEDAIIPRKGASAGIEREEDGAGDEGDHEAIGEELDSSSGVDCRDEALEF